MAEISFAKNPTTITETQVVPTPDPETNVETVTGSTPAAPTNTVTAVVTRKPLPIGDTIPDFSDIILPRLNIVQKVGQMSEVFPGGAVVFNGDTVIYTPPALVAPGQPAPAPQPPLEFIVIG